MNTRGEKIYDYSGILGMTGRICPVVQFFHHLLIRPRVFPDLVPSTSESVKRHSTTIRSTLTGCFVIEWLSPRWQMRISKVTFNRYHIINVLTFIVIPVRLGAASRTSVATPHIRIYGLVGGLLGTNFRSYLFSKVVSLDLGLSWGVVIKPPHQFG